MDHETPTALTAPLCGVPFNRRNFGAALISVTAALGLPPRDAKASMVLVLLPAAIPSLLTYVMGTREAEAAARRHRETLDEQARLQREAFAEQREAARLRELADREATEARIRWEREQIRLQAAVNERAQVLSLLSSIEQLNRQAGRTDGIVQFGDQKVQIDILVDERGAPMNMLLSANADGKGTSLDVGRGRVIVGRGGFNGALDPAVMMSLGGGKALDDTLDVPVSGFEMGLRGAPLSNWMDALARDIERSARPGSARASAGDYLFVAERRFSRARKPTAAGADRKLALFARRVPGQQRLVGRWVPGALA